MANPFFRNPQVRYPGCINQVPPSDERNTYQSLNMLGIESINRSDFPLLITNSVSGDVLVFDGTEWINQNWIPLPFGFGQAPTADHTLLVSGGLLVGASAEIVGNTLLDANLTVAGTGTVGGFWGVGTVPAHRFHALDGTVETWFDNVIDNPAGATGWHINRPGNSNIPHVINWYMDHNYLWGMGVDSATDSTSGDFIVVNDNFTLFNGGNASDCLRFSPGNASAHGIKGIFGGPVGTPRNQPQLFTFQGSANLCPLGVLINSDNSGIDALRMFRTASGTHCIRLNFNDEWIFGNDIGFTNDSSLAWFSAAGGTRLYLKGGSAKTAALGIGTGNPLGIVSANSSTDSSLYDKPQIYFLGSFADSPIDHSIVIETILNAGSVNNYVMLQGYASGSVASPTLTSQFGASFGVRSTDTSLDLITAAQGTGLALIKGLSMDSAGNISIPGTLTAGSISFSGLTLSQRTTQTSTALTTTDYYLWANTAASGITVTLPTAIGNGGRTFVVKKVDTSPNFVTVTPPGGQTIDSQSAITWNSAQESLGFVSDNANWNIT